jgi:hypothetical protein
MLASALLLEDRADRLAVRSDRKQANIVYLLLPKRAMMART